MCGAHPYCECVCVSVCVFLCDGGEGYRRECKPQPLNSLHCLLLPCVHDHDSSRGRNTSWLQNCGTWCITIEDWKPKFPRCLIQKISTITWIIFSMHTKHKEFHVLEDLIPRITAPRKNETFNWRFSFSHQLSPKLNTIKNVLNYLNQQTLYPLSLATSSCTWRCTHV